MDGDTRVLVESDRDRIARGPFARLLVSAVVVDEGAERAERGRRLARAGAVAGVRAEAGLIAAEVTGDGGIPYRVELRAEPVPRRVWTSVAGSTTGRELVQAALEGRRRAVQLEHTMTVDWEEPLVPHARALGRRCVCEDWARHGHVCQHVAALGYVLAYLVDRDVSLLLRWRGCDPAVATGHLPAEPRPEAAPTPIAADSWAAGALPEIGPARPLPVGAVVKRLGRSGIRVGGDDLATVLERAYAVLARHE